MGSDSGTTALGPSIDFRNMIGVRSMATCKRFATRCGMSRNRAQMMARQRPTLKSKVLTKTNPGIASMFVNDGRRPQSRATTRKTIMLVAKIRTLRAIVCST